LQASKSRARYVNYFKIGHKRLRVNYDAANVTPKNEETAVAHRSFGSPAYGKELLKDLARFSDDYEKKIIGRL